MNLFPWPGNDFDFEHAYLGQYWICYPFTALNCINWTSAQLQPVLKVS